MDLNGAEELISEIKKGNMVLLMDDEDRENEGDLILAGEKVTAEKINFMAKHGRGLICLAMSQSKCEALNLNQMVNDNKSGHGTGFTISIEAASGITTGISAADRARTIAVASKSKAKANEIIISQQTQELVKHVVHCVPAQPVKIKGFANSLPVFSAVNILKANHTEPSKISQR